MDTAKYNLRAAQLVEERRQFLVTVSTIVKHVREIDAEIGDVQEHCGEMTREAVRSALGAQNEHLLDVLLPDELLMSLAKGGGR